MIGKTASSTEISNAIEPFRSAFGIPLGHKIPVEIIRENGELDDGTSIYKIAEKFVLHVSPEGYEGISGDECAAMESARRRLGEKSGDVILPIVARGHMDRKSFMIIPLCGHNSNYRVINKVQRFLLRQDILGWLRELVSLSAIPSDGARDDFLANLESIASEPSISPRIRIAAENGIRTIQHGFSPRFTPMHGDLWSGNILRYPGRRFIVIDWRTSNMNGYGIYDLIRFSDSYGMSPRLILRELRFHEQILQGNSELFLVSAIGSIFRNIGNFPIKNFLKMSDRCFEILDSAIQAKSFDRRAML